MGLACEWGDLGLGWECCVSCWPNDVGEVPVVKDEAEPVRELSRPPLVNDSERGEPLDEPPNEETVRFDPS